MTFIPVPDAALAIVEYGDVNQQWTNTLWFTQADFVLADQLALADAVHNHLGTNLMPNLNDGWDLLKVTVYDMRTEDGPLQLDSEDPVTGGVTGSKSPLSIALVVTLRTGGRGRSSRGRNYITGFDEEDTGSELVTDATIVTNIAACYDNMDAIAAVEGWDFVVCSRAFGGSPRVEGVTFQVTDAEVRDARFGHQRRRVPRP